MRFLWEKLGVRTIDRGRSVVSFDSNCQKVDGLD